jgi:DNA-binding HxlR family transcriptional regulator
MEKENESSTRDRKLDEIIEKHAKLDDICRQIFLTLQAYRTLRFNELLKYLKKFGVDITNPTLIEHLNHLRKQKLVSCKRSFQEARYSLTDEVYSLLSTPEEDLKEWFESSIDAQNVPEKLRQLPFSMKELCDKLSESELDEEIDKRLNIVLTLNLFELKTFVDYDLRLDKPESDTAFWNFVGKPFYRIVEESIVRDCRNSERYRIKLFEKIDALVSKLRPDKKLVEEREARRTKHIAK